MKLGNVTTDIRTGGRFWLALGAVLMAFALCAATDVPEPQPVKSSVEITALYYPGTEHMPEWDMVKQVVPQIRPLLGWYDEGDPANVDWQIKWAVEHGISSFCVCWYWNKGEQRLGRPGEGDEVLDRQLLQHA